MINSRSRLGLLVSSPNVYKNYADELSKTSAFEIADYRRSANPTAFDVVLVEDAPASTALETARIEAERIAPSARIVVVSAKIDGVNPAGYSPKIIDLLDCAAMTRSALVCAVERAALAAALDENARLRRTIQTPTDAEISPVAMQIAAAFDERAFPSRSVFLIGESQAELAEIATELYRREIARRASAFLDAARRGGFYAVDCSATAERLESLLFGDAKRCGILDADEFATVALYNVSNMPLKIQTELRRRFVDKQETSARLIFCADVDIYSRVADGDFDRELFRLYPENVLRVPPLKERLDDAPKIANDVLRRVATEWNQERKILAAAAISRLKEYVWPGGVDELTATIRSAAERTPGTVIGPAALTLGSRLSGAPARTAQVAGLSWREIERRALVETIQMTGGNRAKAARVLGVSEKTIYNKIREFKLKGIV